MNRLSLTPLKKASRLGDPTDVLLLYFRGYLVFRLEEVFNKSDWSSSLILVSNSGNLSFVLPSFGRNSFSHLIVFLNLLRPIIKSPRAFSLVGAAIIFLRSHM